MSMSKQTHYILFIWRMAGKGQGGEDEAPVSGDKVEKTAKQLEKEAKKQAKLDKFLQKQQKQPTEAKVNFKIQIHSN